MTRRGHLASAAVIAGLLAAAVVGTVRADGPAAAAADPFQVPNGNSAQLAAFIQNTVSKPYNAEGAVKARRAVVQAADKILAGKPSDHETFIAVFYKTQVLSPEAADAFESQLKRAGKDGAAQTAHMTILMRQLDQAAGDDEALRRKIKEVNEFLGTPPLPQGCLSLVKAVGEALDRIGDDKFACRTYESMLHSVDTVPQLKATPEYQKAAGALHRLKLVGNAMPLEGKTLDGEAFKLSSLHGKVVLVVFWSSTSPACIEEMKNVKGQYQKYHDKGFEVVGINVDSTGSLALAQFIKKEEIPGTICRDVDAMHSMVSEYGVTITPVLILVGRNGKVVSLHAAGDELAPLVEKALSAVVEESAESKNKKKAEAAAAKRKAAALARAPKFRDWSDTGGSFHAKAKFRGALSDKAGRKMVKLELEDGSVISKPLEDLSDADQEYIRQRTH